MKDNKDNKSNKSNKDNKDNKQNEEENHSNKFTNNWAENESPEHFAGDEQVDQFTVDNDYNKNLDLRMTSPMGGIFMHPMHDATLDNYGNDLDLQVDQSDKEKK